MNRKKSSIRGLLLVMTALLPVLAYSYVEAQGPRTSSIAVVVHPDTPVTDLSLDEVRKIFLGDRQYWSSKLPVVLLMRAPVAHERDVVLRVVYQMNEAQFKRYWIAKIFRAESATPPKTYYSNDMANELTATIPGAIAIMDASELPRGVKVVRIDGHLPTDSDYPLK